MRLGQVVESTGEIKAEVRRWWNARPCGSTVSPEEPGTRAFYEAVERHRYAQEPHIPKVVDFPAWAGKDVLEVGCGLGTDLLQLARAGARVTGIDLTSRAVELTARRFRLYEMPGRFLVGDAENLGFRDETFDLVYSNGVLHHTPDTARAVREVHRVLRPGGTALVMLYHRDSYNYWINIRVLRGISFALMRRGVSPGWIGVLTGVSPALLEEYDRAIRGRSRWTVQDLLNNNTDGPGNPLSKVFSRRQARRLFDGFRSVETSVRWLVRKNIPIVGRYLPAPLDDLLGRVAGWALYVRAVK